MCNIFIIFTLLFYNSLCLPLAIQIWVVLPKVKHTASVIKTSLIKSNYQRCDWLLMSLPIFVRSKDCMIKEAKEDY